MKNNSDTTAGSLGTADRSEVAPKEGKRSAGKEGITSLGAVCLAFLASQHHNLHMLLIALGLGSAGMSFMNTFPLIRHVMLLMSLAMVGLMAYRAYDSKRPASMRVMNLVSVVLTLGLVAWSVSQFGL